MNTSAARRGSVGALIVLLLAGLLVAGSAPARAEAHVTRRVHMLQLTNTDRVERDRRRLGLNDRLSRFAKRHSREMAEKGYLFHTDTDALIRALSRYDWSLGGENVGVGDSLDSLESAFMQSKEHRKNILRREFDHTAIGIVRVNGTLWVTVVFYG